MIYAAFYTTMGCLLIGYLLLQFRPQGLGQSALLLLIGVLWPLWLVNILCYRVFQALTADSRK